MTKLFKMSTADKVAEVYTLNRANLVTLSASRTFIIIDSSKIVNNLDRALRTSLLTLHASYASVRANLTNLSTLIMAGAFNHNT